MKRFLVLAVLVLGSFGLAGEIRASEELNTPLYTFRHKYYDDAEVDVTCWDYLAESRALNEDVADIARQMRDDPGTDSVMLCQVDHVSGDPSFLPTELEYVANGFQYRVSNFYPHEGTVGRIREGASAQFLAVLPEVVRGVPFDLYLGDGGVSVILNPVDTF